MFSIVIYMKGKKVSMKQLLKQLIKDSKASKKNNKKIVRKFIITDKSINKFLK